MIDLRAGDGARTHDSHVGNAENEDTNLIHDKTLRPMSVSVARQLPNDPDFARLAAAWAGLPEPIRRAVLALIDSSGP